MEYTASPIAFGGQSQTVTLSVDDSPGGLMDWVLLELSVWGGEAIITLNGQDISYPVTLQLGDVLSLTPQGGAALSVINALAPLRDYVPPAPLPIESQGLMVSSNPDSSLSSDDPRITTNPDGSLSADDSLVTVNADGSYSEV